MPTLRIAPAGLAQHFWVVPEKGAPAVVGPDDLDLDDDLADRLEAWGDAYDAVVIEDRGGADWPSAEAEAIWRAEGALLAAALKIALGPDWTVESRF